MATPLRYKQSNSILIHYLFITDIVMQDEFHSRLKFNRRGLVGMASSGKDDNTSQFFFTLNRADELNGKHTLFGKVREEGRRGREREEGERGERKREKLSIM